MYKKFNVLYLILSFFLFSSCSNMLECLNEAEKKGQPAGGDKISYTIRHYKQNLEDDNFTLIDDSTETKALTRIKTDAEIPQNLAKTFEGFNARLSLDSSENLIIIKYERKTVEYSFEAEGGSWSNGKSKIVLEGKYGRPVTAPENPVKITEQADFKFSGWDKAIPLNFGLEPLTFKAKWESDKVLCKIEHYKQNSENDEYTKVDVDTQEVKLPPMHTTADVPMEYAKTYVGFENPSPRLDEFHNIEYYYDRKTTTITLNANGGKWENDSLEKTVIGKRGAIPNMPEAPELSGFVFAGWALNYNLADVIYDDNNSYTIPLEGENDSITLYAVWKTSAGKKAFVATTESISEVVSALSSDAEIIIIGAVNNENILSIRDAIKLSNYKINLTISETTKITSLPSYSFKECNKLTGINIPDSVTAIGSEVFMGCTELVYVRIPVSVTSIGNFAFRNCTKLTEIELPDSISEISIGTFVCCSNLISIDIPDTVKTIEQNVFEQCEKLSSVKLPSSLTNIRLNAFANCIGLTTIEIPDSVVNIDTTSFYGCVSLKNIKVNENNPKYLSENGIVFNKEKTALLFYPAGRTEDSYTIPSNITTIGEYAFNCCNNLKTLVISSSVTTIEFGGIFDCENLESISIPVSNLKTIGDFVFCNSRKLLSLTIPASVDRIGDHVFDGLDLTTITFEDTLNWYKANNSDDWNNKENGEPISEYNFDLYHQIEVNKICDYLYKL